ncbi:hypothetical protein GIB67_042037 [Kingdonia uniflora]|uniref:Uncharacterized protein n=1 Tax=Kingdonia uniflora TaxID=39325 RepID=A0A7J7MVR4_9MAGN|nr:hypothetical protein GIB67_042037 [Kingdonia uniflora]
MKRLASECVDKDHSNIKMEIVSKDSRVDDTSINSADWEAIADRSSDEVFFPKLDSAIKKLTLKDTKAQTSKRRGRGSFLYKKNGLYSDQEPSGTASDVSDDEVLHPRLVEKAEIIKFKYGTSHVLVLADFPPSTRIADLEELFEKFSDRGVSIRWVNDTVALAVFRTPCIGGGGGREGGGEMDFLVHPSYYGANMTFNRGEKYRLLTSYREEKIAVFPVREDKRRLTGVR